MGATSSRLLYRPKEGTIERNNLSEQEKRRGRDKMVKYATQWKKTGSAKHSLMKKTSCLKKE